MQEIYDLIVRALKPRIGSIDLDKVQATFATWELIPLTRGNVLVGVALRKETELHLIIDPQYQNTICFIRQCKQIVAETIAKYGYADTKVVNEHVLGHRLAELLKFKLITSNAEMTYYKKEE